MLYQLSSAGIRPQACVPWCVIGGLLLAGCVDSPPWTGAAKHPSAERIAALRMENDEYVYFPRHEIYYNRTQRQFVYQEGGGWVSRDEPPPMVPRDLLNSPLVVMDFHDSPAAHHAAVRAAHPRDTRDASDVVLNNH